MTDVTKARRGARLKKNAVRAHSLRVTTGVQIQWTCPEWVRLGVTQHQNARQVFVWEQWLTSGDKMIKSDINNGSCW